MRSAIVYIDGFNLYHAIDALREPELKWLDLRALAESILRKDEVLREVKYFTAFATWRPDSFTKHRAYVSALEARGVHVILGQFKEKPRHCASCKYRWTGHEEKETDVQIAVHMVADAVTGSADRIVLISADTDLSPPIKMIASLRPECEVFVAAPPKRLSKCRSLGPKLEITAGRLRRCLLPNPAQISPQQYVGRPDAWAPIVDEQNR